LIQYTVVKKDFLTVGFPSFTFLISLKPFI